MFDQKTEFSDHHEHRRRRQRETFIGTALYNDQPVVYKFSVGHDFRTQHEYNVMCTLQDIPNMCRPVKLLRGVVINLTEALAGGNPFSSAIDIPGMEYLEDVDVLLMKSAPSGSVDLYELKLNRLCTNDEFHALMARVFLTVRFAYEQHRFTHYDLHAGNILVWERLETANLDDADVFKFKDDKSMYLVPRYRFDFIILDFEFTYTEQTSTEWKSRFELACVGMTPFMANPSMDWARLTSSFSIPLKFIKGRNRCDVSTGLSISVNNDLVRNVVWTLLKHNHVDMNSNRGTIFYGLILLVVSMKAENSTSDAEPRELSRELLSWINDQDPYLTEYPSLLLDNVRRSLLPFNNNRPPIPAVLAKLGQFARKEIMKFHDPFFVCEDPTPIWCAKYKQKQLK